MRADNTHHLVAAARRRALETRQRALVALRHLHATGQPVSFDTVARAARVSRSWLYGQQDLRAEIQQLRTRHDPGPSSLSVPIPARQRASDASLRRRLEAAGAEIGRLREENRQLRERLAWAHGELRTAKIQGLVPAHEGLKARQHGPKRYGERVRRQPRLLSLPRNLACRVGRSCCCSP